MCTESCQCLKSLPDSLKSVGDFCTDGSHLGEFAPWKPNRKPFDLEHSLMTSLVKSDSLKRSFAQKDSAVPPGIPPNFPVDSIPLRVESILDIESLETASSASRTGNPACRVDARVWYGRIACVKAQNCVPALVHSGRLGSSSSRSFFSASDIDSHFRQLSLSGKLLLRCH